MQEDYWPKFWKLYGRFKHPNAGKIHRVAADVRRL
jgi:hypothetical protein